MPSLTVTHAAAWVVLGVVTPPMLALGAPGDVADLLAAARGAPPALCAMAARSVGNGWGGGYDAPAPPLPPARERRWRDPLPADEQRLLLSSLATEDPCVQEVAIRLLGTQRGDLVVSGLRERLAAPDSALRAVAALGLGLVDAESAVEALLRAARDRVARRPDLSRSAIAGARRPAARARPRRGRNSPRCGR